MSCSLSDSVTNYGVNVSKNEVTVYSALKQGAYSMYAKLAL